MGGGCRRPDVCAEVDVDVQQILVVSVLRSAAECLLAVEGSKPFAFLVNSAFVPVAGVPLSCCPSRTLAPLS